MAQPPLSLWHGHVIPSTTHGLSLSLSLSVSREADAITKFAEPESEVEPGSIDPYCDRPLTAADMQGEKLFGCGTQTSKRPWE